MEGIFISYRRDDSAGYAGRLYDRLAAHFGDEAVFMDVEGIEPGTDFVKAIEGAVASCKVLIVLIGREWLSATDASGRRRLDDPHDFVRLETSAALKRDIRVVPVLVDQAIMPEQQDLPEELQLLVRRQAVELNHKQWDATSSELIKTLEKILKLTPTGGAPSPSRHGAALWISLGALVAVIAGVAYWQFAPLNKPETRLVEAAAPADKKETSEPLNTVIKPSPEPLPTEPREIKMSPPDKVDESQSVQKADEKAAGPTTDAAATVKEQRTAEQPEVAAPKPVVPSETMVKQPAVEEKPLPVPVQPEVKPEPPVIKSLTTVNDKSNVLICYLVESASRLRLTPVPGELKDPSKECINVDVEKATIFTLTASGPGGKVSKKISVSPHPNTIAKLETPSRLPLKGEFWVYQTKGKWPTTPRWQFQIGIQQADDKMVYETLSILKPVTKEAGIRKSSGGDPTILSLREIGLEFSPWLDAYIKLTGKESWGSIFTPKIDSWDGWSSNASVGGVEQIKVPAGNFEAWKVEAWSSRKATGGSTLAAMEPVRVQFQVWYSPKIKRYVKCIRKVISASGQVQEEDLFELTEYKQH